MIDRPLSALEAVAHLVKRYQALPIGTRELLLTKIAGYLLQADQEFDEIGDRISKRRDWLDEHRGDSPPHPSYEKRRKHFYEVDSRAHAEAGDLLDRAYALITTKAAA